MREEEDSTNKATTATGPIRRRQPPATAASPRGGRRSVCTSATLTSISAQLLPWYDLQINNYSRLNTDSFSEQKRKRKKEDSFVRIIIFLLK